MTVLKSILTRYVYKKPLYAENKDVQLANDVATTSKTKTLTPMLRRNSVPPRDKSHTEKRRNANSQKPKCVLCGSKKYIQAKYRLCEPEAVQFFLDATKFFQDEVYSKKADLTLVNLITAVDILYHKKCYANYSWKYERAKSGNENAKNYVETNLTNKKKQLFHLTLEELDSQKN